MDERAISIEKYTEALGNIKIDFEAIKNNITNGIKNYTFKEFREHTNILCYFCFNTLYICYGFLQFLAIWTGLTKITHHDNIIIALISFILGFTPFIGPISGLFGAHIGWGWDYLYSLFFFIAPYFLVNTPIYMIILIEVCKDIKRWQENDKANVSL